MIAARASLAYVRDNIQDVGNDDPRSIDLVHLARQTDGDFALERELLSMFDVQSAKLIARLAMAEVSAQAKADIAHRLRGSALAVGARRVAVAAERVEAHYVEIVATGSAPRIPLADLQVAVAEARTEIGRLIG